METNIQKWGNSLGVRLPQNLVNKQALVEGSRVLVTETKTGLAIELVKQSKLELSQLVRRITLKNRHDEVHFDKPVGKEVW